MQTSRRAFVGGAVSLAIAAKTAKAAIEEGVPPADRELRVPVSGGNLYVRVNGNINGPRPPLLLVHGGPGAALWQFFPALPLAADRAIILYDQLDSGRSDAPGNPANWTVDRFVGEIDSICSVLGVVRFHLLGHSWGGIIANRYAARRPAGLASVILQGAPLSAWRGEESVRNLAAALAGEDGALIIKRQREGVAAVDAAAYHKASAAFMRKHVYRTSVREVAMPYMAPTPEDRGNAVATALIGDDLLGGFGGVLTGFDDEALSGKIEAPTLLLRGEYDLMTDAATRATLLRLKRGYYEEIGGAGHMAQFDRPDVWRSAVSRFIGSHDGQGRSSRQSD